MSLMSSLTGFLRGEAANAKRAEDLRSMVRVPQRMRSGFLWTDKLIYPRPVMIRDLSLRGARVEIVGDPVKLSILADGVKLYFEAEKHEMLCSVRWARGLQLGLRFESGARPPSRKYK
jgi:hypothetical protein